MRQVSCCMETISVSWIIKTQNLMPFLNVVNNWQTEISVEAVNRTIFFIAADSNSDGTGSALAYTANL